MNTLLEAWGRIFNFPIFKSGEAQFTIGHLIELLILLALVMLTEVMLRRVFLARVLARTRLRPSVQFAVRQILASTPPKRL